MKATKALLSRGLIFVLIFSALLVGCGAKNQSGLTIDEPEITVEYLENEYVEQLTRDGAEHIFGTIKLTKGEDGVVNVAVNAKNYVEDSSQPGGFYIEDRNYSVTVALAPEARCTLMKGGVGIPDILDTETFYKDYTKDIEQYSASDATYEENKMYDMYVMGDQIELILEKYIP